MGMKKQQKQLLVVFLKYPEPGKVKTRLAQTIGPRKAAEIYRRLVSITLNNTHSANYSRCIWYFPARKEQAIKEWLAVADPFFVQKGGDLGEKMAYVTETHLAQHFTKVAIIGTDCPFVDAKLIQRAFDGLERRDCVIGPSEDGGYYLLALKKFYPAIFKQINWSTSHVLSQTIAQLDSQHLTYAFLPEFLDIDTYEDLQTLRCEYPQILF
jgi:hypothetical protein